MWSTLPLKGFLEKDILPEEIQSSLDHHATQPDDMASQEQIYDSPHALNVSDIQTDELFE
jgi:hypothetical protein